MSLSQVLVKPDEKLVGVHSGIIITDTLLFANSLLGAPGKWGKQKEKILYGLAIY
jgi:hypothetical protein